MSSFTEPLILEALNTHRGGRGEFCVHVPFSYEVGHLGSGDLITVPKGYVTDLVSVPWFARPFIPLSGRLAKPALLHDWLFEQKDKRASSIFLEAMLVNEVPVGIAYFLFYFVAFWWYVKYESSFGIIITFISRRFVR